MTEKTPTQTQHGIVERPETCQTGSRHTLRHTDTIGALPSLETDRVTATKKFSLPHGAPVKIEKHQLKKKASKDGCFSGLRKIWPNDDFSDPEEEQFGGCEVTASLESAVRKISRTSPGRPPGGGVRAGLAILARGYEQYREGIQLLRPTEFGEASSDDLSSEWETSDLENNNTQGGGLSFSPTRRGFHPLPSSPCRPLARHKGGLSAWKKVRNAVQWTPFIQTFKAKRYPWVQLAGHSGNFRAGETPGTVLKKRCPQEEAVYRVLMRDQAISDLVPLYYRTICCGDEDEQFLELEDCLALFNSSPCIMDCKVGIRTYQEEELAKAREKPKLRKDMYEKMVAVDPSAPTEQEHSVKGVTKPRYMVWRETISSTATLGFRIEGIKKDGSSSKDFKTTATKEQVVGCFQNFLFGYPDAVSEYVRRLENIKCRLEGSEFFKGHELIGSSLLFVHDDKRSNIWLIDFGKTSPLPSDTKIDHKSAWEVGNHEDGYLIGLENIINIFKQLEEAQISN